MSRRTLPLFLTAILMLTGFLMPVLRVAACLTSDSGMPSGCPMKADFKPTSVTTKPADKHGCCRETQPNPETKVITGACCCTIKAAAKPAIRDYRSAGAALEVVLFRTQLCAQTDTIQTTAPVATRAELDVRISRGPPRGAAPHRGPPTIS
jgi:hypothetical protein